MDNAIAEVLRWINGIFGLLGNNALLSGGIDSFSNKLYGYVLNIMQNVVMPVAYVILALFFVMELYKASTKTESMGGHTMGGVEIVFRVLVKLVFCKMVLDSVPLILGAIFQVTTHLTAGIANVIGTEEAKFIDPLAIQNAVGGIQFWQQFIVLMFCFIVFLVVMVAIGISLIVCAARFIELYVYTAIAPIPLATMPNAEMSQIGKNFLKNYAAVCLQGTILFMVLSFFPVLVNATIIERIGSSGGNVFQSTTQIYLALFLTMAYATLLLLAVMQSGKWAKSICGLA
jgi:hypothetical protein